MGWVSTPPASPPGRPRRVVRPAEVIRTERISPTFQRLVVGGADLANFQPGKPASHVKLILPDTDGQLPLVKTEDGWGFPPPPEGTPPGPPPFTVRTYTPRSWDAGAGELTIDFALHAEPGPAASWATEARPGDVCAIAGPGAGYDVDPVADPLVLVGDETALPAIGMILESRPAGVPTLAMIEVPDAADADVLPGADVRWLVRTNGTITGELMAGALRGLAGTLSNARVFAAGEAALIRGLRTWLLKEEGLPVGSIVTRGYWKRGSSNHPDHDYGDD